MHCYYKVNGEVRRFFYGQYSGMTMYDKNGNETGHFDVVMQDKKPHHFDVDGQTIMCKEDMVCMTPAELVEAIKEKNRVWDSDLCCTLIKHGIDSLTLKIRSKPLEKYNFGGGLIVSFRSESARDKVEDMIWVDYKFTDNEYVRNPWDCYKLVLIARDEAVRDWYPKEDYYVCDLVSLISARPDLFQLEVSNEYNESEVMVNG